MDLSLETPEVVERMGPHPLTIHLIAESIFSQLEEIEDLMSCRHVAWPWRQTVIPLINSRSHEFTRMTFSGSEAEIENPNNPDDASPSLTKLTKYMNYLEEEVEMEPKFMFSSFRFYNLPLEEPIAQQFLNQFGHTIRNLDLTANKEPDYEQFGAHDDHSRSGGSVESFWKLLSTQCPQLQELNLEQVSFQTKSEDKFPPFQSKIKRLTFIHYYRTEREKLQRLRPLIMNFFRNCHLLERLILYLDICSEVFASALCESPHLSALKELTLESVGVVEVWRRDPARSENILRNLRLKKLKIVRLYNGEVDELNWFLQSLKNSLETLVIGFWYDYSFQTGAIPNPQNAPFPAADVMEKLREFQIFASIDGLHFVFPLIDFQRQFPCLNTLILAGDANKHPMDSWFVIGSEPQLTLKALELPGGMSPEHLRRAVEIFPNLKQLQIRKLGELAARQLFSQWPQLESLFLVELEDPDSILTGLSARQLEAAEKIRLKIGSGINGIMSLISPSKMAPSIANFKNLQELYVYNSGSTEPLTDLSLRYAISKLENLENLHVVGYKFSDEVIKDFRNSIPHLQLKIEPMHCGEAFRYQKDLPKRYNAIPSIDEEFTYPFY